MGETGDTSANLRTTMGALRLFGTPPEEYWPYTDKQPKFDEEPSAFCYAFAENYKAITYYRLDTNGVTQADLLNTIKERLTAGLLSMFGFTVYSSIAQAAAMGGKIPFPVSGERTIGGHAIVAIGYDDGMEITNKNAGATKTVGALLIRNSWGTSWGDGGYGWLPYEYVLKGLAVDWWSLIKNEWIDTKNFGV